MPFLVVFLKALAPLVHKGEAPPRCGADLDLPKVKVDDLSRGRQTSTPLKDT